MIKLLLLVLGVLAGNSNSLSQTQLRGLWNGAITTDGYDAKASYIISVEEQKDGIISGKALLYKPNIFSHAFGLLQFTGTVNNNKILINDLYVVDERMPTSYHFLCIKSCELQYSRQDTTEYLSGNWNSNSENCIPGKIMLSRLSAQDSRQVPQYVLAAIKKSGEKATFMNTELYPPIVLNVKHHVLIASIQDYMKPDNDTVSIFLNRKLLYKGLNIEKKPFMFPIKLNRQLAANEIILYANNLGKIPPNTSMLTLSDGEVKHKVMIESTLQKSAVIYLRTSP